MSTQKEKDEMGLIHLILDGMHPAIKALVFGMLAIPLVLAVSGMMLQLNVGKLIEQAIADQSNYQLQAQREEGDRVITAIQSSINAIVNDVAILDTRLTNVEKDIEETRKWACAHSDKQNLSVDKPYFCK